MFLKSLDIKIDPLKETENKFGDITIKLFPKILTNFWNKIEWMKT